MKLFIIDYFYHLPFPWKGCGQHAMIELKQGVEGSCLTIREISLIKQLKSYEPGNWNETRDFRPNIVPNNAAMSKNDNHDEKKDGPHTDVLPQIEKATDTTSSMVITSVLRRAWNLLSKSFFNIISSIYYLE